MSEPDKYKCSIKISQTQMQVVALEGITVSIDGPHEHYIAMSPIECLIYDVKRLNHLITLLAMSQYMFQEDE